MTTYCRTDDNLPTTEGLTELQQAFRDGIAAAIVTAARPANKQTLEALVSLFYRAEIGIADMPTPDDVLATASKVLDRQPQRSLGLDRVSDCFKRFRDLASQELRYRDLADHPNVVILDNHRQIGRKGVA
jgi:hypothetical protein